MSKSEIIQGLISKKYPESQVLERRLEWMLEALGVPSINELSDSSIDRLLQDFFKVEA